MTTPWELFLSLLGPWQFLYIVTTFLPSTLVHVFQTQGFGGLTWPRIQDVWFSKFWALAGANIRKDCGPRITALLEGRVTQGRVVDAPVAAPVSGVVLEIGPGLGFWVDLFAQFKDGSGVRTRSGGKGKTLKVFGVEPNVDAHPSLRKRVEAAGLEEVYEILPVGIEALGKYDIAPESVDCIVSLLCLCGIPEPEKNIAELYKYLKKGGRWYLYEHVQAKSSWFMRFYQAFVNLFWPHLLGGCQLCRDTEQTLRKTGSWTAVDVAQPPDEPWHATVPHMFGTFTK